MDNFVKIIYIPGYRKCIIWFQSKNTAQTVNELNTTRFLNKSEYEKVYIFYPLEPRL